ncbi:ABC transporter substrate-binding protein [Tessaracoccus sp. OH4464_COT-324]|uniref:ABC transporter substrate-binding protein n=1 Tax=Tessaracoccus sp. OH4464_COT-324 TaxID=2491059 RepID=UPI000F6348FE|nr:ABC transporter substrate-binding protein [Tessaracoccus sp. OH4464_COT-324]RRD47011.1 ABC transporter substrate-binding protein [Tessaracoccus sp. OH4464_COT-324]
MRKVIAITTAALALAACSPTGGGSSATDRSYDVAKIEKVDELAALVPAKIREKGKLVVGSAIDYAPAEFRAADLQTAIGYDIDLAKAIGRVLDLQVEISPAEFASLLPGIGTRYDVGISSFSITPERIASYNMISYVQVGSSFAVKKGNPSGFSSDDVCGKAIAVQNGTWQHEDLDKRSQECTSQGKPAIEVLVYSSQSDATTNVVGGKAAAFYADSTVADYAATLTNGQLETAGGVLDSAPQGIVVAQDDAELTAALQRATQHLMTTGVWREIMTSWGTEAAILNTAELNPQG